jgi:hypothetical protein
MIRSKKPVGLIALLLCPILVAQTPISTTSSTPLKPTASSAGSVAVKPNTLLDGTPIKLRIGRTISSADAKVGEHIDFEVLDEVQVMGVVIIAKGATASGTVTSAESKRRMGRGGKLELTLDYVRLVDNEKAALTATAGGKGGSHTGAMIGAMVATSFFTLGGSALFLLMHGKDIRIAKGAETTAYVSGDMSLDLAKFATPAPVGAPSTENAAQATLSVESTPAGAEIEVDGNFIGDTPSILPLRSGNHEITVKKKGFADWSRKLNVNGGTIHLDAELEQKTGE